MSEQHVCPWWLGYLLASPLRKFLQNPTRILAPYVKEGMTSLDIGPGMGFFTLPMLRLVGSTGKVIAVDLQPQMIESLRRRATRAGLSDRLETRLCNGDSLGLDNLAGMVDFALTFAVLHETPDIKRVFTEIHHTLKPGGTLLVAEPPGHVKKDEFAVTISLARAAGFELVDSPKIPRSHTALLLKR